MQNPQTRTSASAAIAAFRRYVTDYVNRHDFSVIPEFMTDDYTLTSSGVRVAGRDGDYRAAVARQLEQFPGLTFTPHELVHVGDRVAVRFTEHGASNRHGGAAAAWPSIAIYTLRDGRLAHCSIEQDYFSRRRQLDTREPVRVEAPAIAPWDTPESVANPAAETLVAAWLASGAFLAAPGVEVDDSRATGQLQTIIAEGQIEILEIMSGDDRVAFHAIQSGVLAGDFPSDLPPEAGRPAHIHLSGLVRVAGGQVAAGHVIRDRWGLYRRLTRPA
ncbi:nuclear transport factor 2 family protein [Phenylobacterium sp. J367]|uniref:nuclear transport factor 2 family protein n=1 Tax=Phenylobacterium sp. J367 TaxID=2898435 RepID=UPI0021517406|nr:nuclear transport factor 2 family protein [Phenylobacterium sp. J367]MCR5879578.1 nuclear transport factor 2 family protein [Phenylobacterium sp. J367]